jgi:hypothetical protein
MRFGIYASGVAERFRHITYDQCITEEVCHHTGPKTR